MSITSLLYSEVLPQTHIESMIAILKAGNNQVVQVSLSGNGDGLIDHCTFTGGGGSENIHNLGLGSGNYGGYQDNISPGSQHMMYVENSYFNNVHTGIIASFTEGYYGSRSCFRYNTFVYGQIDQHGNSNPCARWYEIYNNTFVVPANQNQSNFFAIRGGSGFIYNNTATGGPNLGAGIFQFYCDGTAFLNWGPGSGIYVNGTPNPAPASPVIVGIIPSLFPAIVTLLCLLVLRTTRQPYPLRMGRQPRAVLMSLRNLGPVFLLTSLFGNRQRDV